MKATQGDLPVVVAIVVNYKTPEMTAECVRLVRGQRSARMEVVVVDNDSGPDHVSRLRSLLPNERIVETGCNSGFAGGVNAGIAAAWSENPAFLWVVTPDVAVQPECLTQLLDAMQADEQIGICGPAINAGDEWIVGYRLVEPLGFLIRVESTTPEAIAQLPRVMPTDFVEGGSMLIRSETAKAVGPFRLEFFLYYEESEYCLRARDLGWRMSVVTRATVVTGARKKERNSRAYYLIRNSIVLARMRERYVATAVVRGAVETCVRGLASPRFLSTGIRAIRDGVSLPLT